MSDAPILLAIRTASDEEGCRTGLTLTREADRLTVWRAEEDENYEIRERAVGHFAVSHAGLYRAIAYMNGFGVWGEIPNDLLRAIRAHPFGVDECFMRDPALTRVLRLAEAPPPPVTPLDEMLFA